MATNITSSAPQFQLHPCDLFGPSFLSCTSTPPDLYFCPEHDCKDPEEFYCPRWGCESLTTPGMGSKQTDAYLSLTYLAGNSRPLLFTIASPEDPGWFTGKTWGVRQYKWGPDVGTVFSIQKIPSTDPYQWITDQNKLPPQHPACKLKPGQAANPLCRQPMGPNEVLNPLQPVPRPQTTYRPTTSVPAITLPQPTQTPTVPVQISSGLGPLWPMLQATYDTLNRTLPNMTQNCWLCLDPRPPYYDAIALNTTYTTSSELNPLACDWGNRQVGITIESIIGRGACIGDPNLILDLPQCLPPPLTLAPASWYIPPPESSWICTTTGLTPCVSSSTLTQAREACLLVTLLPRVLYHPDGQ